MKYFIFILLFILMSCSSRLHLKNLSGDHGRYKIIYILECGIVDSIYVDTTNDENIIEYNYLSGTKKMVLVDESSNCKYVLYPDRTVSYKIEKLKKWKYLNRLSFIAKI